jgi:RNA polymerase sigma-32 factor
MIVATFSRSFRANGQADAGVGRYLRDIQRYPLLAAEEERLLALRWVENGDSAAAHRLVNSHLRLVAKIAAGYRGYGAPLEELISQGNLGLVQAVERFDPHRGFRLSTYAMWWIRAAIQEYIVHSWSLVKMGTTSEQKKLFFNLRRLKGRIGAMEEGDLSPENAKLIADTLNVPEAEVIHMNRRLSGVDASLNASVAGDGESEWQDWLVDETDGHEQTLADHEEDGLRRRLLTGALTGLNQRERDIVTERHLRDQPQTLEQLSVRFGISRERVRQIEVGALAKLKRAVRRVARSAAAAPTDGRHGNGRSGGEAGAA